MRALLKNRWVRAMFILTLFVFYSVGMTLLLGTACPINLLLGVPCPSCGMTRACLSIFTGDIRSAFLIQPAFVLLLPTLAMLIIITAKPPFGRSKTVTVLSFIMTTILLVIYILRMVYWFPHTDPMAFNDNSLLGLVLKLFS